VIVDAASLRGPNRVASVRALESSVAGTDSQVVVTCHEPWTDAPDDVEVVVSPSASLGDRYDAATKSARGDLLAFVGGRVTVRPGWGAEVIRAFAEDPDLLVAGGPVIPTGDRRGQRISAQVITKYLRGTPAAHNARRVPSRQVREVGAENLAIRSDAFWAVGGFQTPAGGGGESVRLCYKVRHLLDGKIKTEAGLAATAPAPSFPGQLLRNVSEYGRSRGCMARRLPEAAPLFPFALPSVSLLLGAVLVFTLVFAARSNILLAAVAAASALFAFSALESMRGFRTQGSLAVGMLAGFVLPVVVFAYGASFFRGYLGRNLEEISPPRDRGREAVPRVLIINWRDVTHPHAGGAEAYMHQIARRWAAMGVEVGWLTQRHSGSRRSEVIDQIQIHRAGGRLTQYPMACVYYLARLRKRYDVIIDCENGIPFFSPLYSRLPKVLVIHHVHLEIFQKHVPRGLRWMVIWLEGSLMPWLYRNDQVVTVSEDTRSDTIGLGFKDDKVTVVTNGVVPPASTPIGRSSTPTILSMGRLTPQKSVDVLIRAIPLILERFPQLQVDIVGQGPDRTRLERLTWSMGLTRHVRFHGYVPGELRDEIAASAWIAVCASAFEGWGVVCMEASARGLPIVGSRVHGLREAIRDGETGLLFEYGNERGLADAALMLLTDPELRMQMGQAGRAWADLHTWDKSASEFAAVMARSSPKLLISDARLWGLPWSQPVEARAVALDKG
jgi:glycosyltransferase involved in cell wall biosynthesis